MKTILSLSVLSILAAGPFVLAVRPGPDAVTARISRAAAGFLAALSPAQRKAAHLGFADAERTNWQFVPGRYPGVALEALDGGQRRLVHRLLNSLLSGSGYAKTVAIMRLEDTLRELAEAAGRKAPHRDPGRYAVAVFGDPRGPKPWGVRLQGHHVSLNFTSVAGRMIAMTPMFLGANPAEVRKGVHAGFRALPEEEDLARALLASLTEEQRGKVMLADKAPNDVLWGPGRTRAVLEAPHGLSFSAMTDAQRAILWELIEAYVRNVRDGMAKPQLKRLEAERQEIRFGWMGGTERGQGHYYRVVGKTFAIEYDNTQNSANHVHVVWHDLTDDFGVDWLKEHYRVGHRK